MGFRIVLRTRVPMPGQEISLVPVHGEPNIGQYRRGCWHFVVSDSGNLTEPYEFQFQAKPSGIRSKRLSVLRVPDGSAKFGPKAVDFRGVVPEPDLSDILHFYDKTRWMWKTAQFVAMFAFFGLLLVPLPVWAATPGFTQKLVHDCDGLPRPKTLPRTTVAKYKLSQQNAADSNVLHFGRSRKTRDTTVYLDIATATSVAASTTSPPTGPSIEKAALAKISGRFTRSDGSFLNNRLIYTQVTLEGGRIALRVCVLRHSRNIDLGHAGTYTGTISIASPDIVHTDVPFTITISYPAWQLVLELLIVMAIPAAWYLWVLHQPSPNQGGRPISWAFFKYCYSLIGVLSLALGSIAAFSVYTATYLRSETWGSSPIDPLSLCGAMFTAFVAAAGTATLGAKAVQRARTVR